MPSRHGLGRGLDALIPETEEQAEVALAEITLPAEQPRKVFTEQALMELASSIKQHGILQPLVVIPKSADSGGGFELIAGERRLRAAKLAGLHNVPVYVRTAEAGDRFELALIENLQRADLSPLEEARAYRKLLNAGELTQETLATRLGKSRSKVANTLRLLGLPPEIAAALEDGRITAGHAQAILAQPAEQQNRLFEVIIVSGLSVREAERWRATNSTNSTSTYRAEPPAWVHQLETTIGTKVERKGTDTKGKLVLHYGSTEELNALLERLGHRE